MNCAAMNLPGRKFSLVCVVDKWSHSKKKIWKKKQRFEVSQKYTLAEKISMIFIFNVLLFFFGICNRIEKWQRRNKNITQIFLEFLRVLFFHNATFCMRMIRDSKDFFLFCCYFFLFLYLSLFKYLFLFRN